jgi:hypothetical protein
VLPLVVEPFAQPVQPRHPAMMQMPQAFLPQSPRPRNTPLRMPALTDQPSAMSGMALRAQPVEHLPAPFAFGKSPSVASRFDPLTGFARVVKPAVPVPLASPPIAPFVPAPPSALIPETTAIETTIVAPAGAFVPVRAPTPKTTVAMMAARPEPTIVAKRAPTTPTNAEVAKPTD